MSPPTYRERLRVEGTVLAACGVASAIAVLALAEGATRRPHSSLIQLGLVAVLLTTFGSRTVRRSMQRASLFQAGAIGTGEPTPLWQLALIVGALTLTLGFAVGWDAALRIGGGCVVVGVAQAFLFERLVAWEEARGGRQFYRVAGSSLFTGTKLGTVPTRHP